MEILKTKILPLKTIFLPDEWYRNIIEHSVRAKQLSQLNASSDEGYVHYAVRLAVYCFDRKYIDTAISRIEFDSWTKDRQRRVFASIGTALFDLGFREEAVSYFESALVASENTEYYYINYYQLCFHLNDKKQWAKRHELVQNYKKLFPEQETTALILLAKSYNDLRQLDEADKTIKILEDNGEDVKILRADYYYCKGEHQQAAILHDMCKSQGYSHWQPQFDYKKAVSYFKTNQKKKWIKQAEKIGRRLVWDKFYSLDYLENEGVERIAEIDKAIYASKNKKRIIYVDKLFLALARIPGLLWRLFVIHRYAVLFYMAGIVLILMLIRAFLKYS